MCRSDDISLRNPERARDERGAVLVWALFFVSLTTGVLIAHSFEMTANRRTMETRYRRVQLAWVDPDEIRADLEAAGFEIEALWGDFDRAPFAPDSGSQVWVAVRPDA